MVITPDRDCAQLLFMCPGTKNFQIGRIISGTHEIAGHSMVKLGDRHWQGLLGQNFLSQQGYTTKMALQGRMLGHDTRERLCTVIVQDTELVGRVVLGRCLELAGHSMRTLG